jgi:hypothetical protein
MHLLRRVAFWSDRRAAPIPRAGRFAGYRPTAVFLRFIGVTLPTVFGVHANVAH